MSGQNISPDIWKDLHARRIFGPGRSSIVITNANNINSLPIITLRQKPLPITNMHAFSVIRRLLRPLKTLNIA
ncbi:MAG: hypothetical protein IIB00_11365 [candidate division Zixibacteria bacterium]|nr:hypothetical protein [candidate division Zixibacteria bacterium]